MDNIVPQEKQLTPIEPNDLWLFAKIADCGSFSKAAEQLALPKSTLSRRISQLEIQLGERLMQRTTRKLKITEFGQHLLDHGRQIAEETQAAIAWAEYRQITPSGELRISMPNDFANLFMAPHLAEFIRRYPAVSLAVDLSARRVDLLGEGYDLAIRMGELPDDAHLSAKRLYRQSSGLYASPAYLARHGIPEMPDDLLSHRILRLIPANREAESWRLEAAQEHWTGLPPQAAAANSPELLVRLACLGQGIVAAPTGYAKNYLLTGELIRVLPAWNLPWVDVWAVFPSRKLMPTKTRVFLDYVSAVLADFDRQSIQSA